MAAILLAAGGTGGHLFPAQALAEELGRRGHVVELATDERADRYGQAFPARKIHIVASATIRGRSPLALARTAFALVRGVIQANGIISHLKPAAVVGFGGYPTLPPLMAAMLRRVPSVLHEQNAVVGRANRLLGRVATAVAASFPESRHSEAFAAKLVHTGNPVRPAVLDVAAMPYDMPAADGPFKLLVFGGSQGARFFSEILPDAIAKLPEAARARLKLVQQCRPEDLDAVKSQYDALGLEVELAPFFTDLPARIAGSHLVICRSGASTVTELSVIGRPSILIPFPHALDADQATNAAVLQGAGGAEVIDQKDLDAERLASAIAERMADPEGLAAVAAAAKSTGRPDAVRRLADLVEHVAAGGRAQSVVFGEQS
ncbi:MAG: undecaprenyldiphospho-muramoylpentapeptide beta-N-acetylglucosaminyltransferase [Hyphomicrobiales bacterium]|nr:MAG: undecaprenyldiphospho-muramoylpentapeptide beta-N-acetylglucosaminyltransferase [Hyphomicrobiales bacterium]